MKIYREIIKINKAIENLKAYEDFEIHMLELNCKKGTVEYLKELISYAELTLDSDEVEVRSLRALAKKVQEAKILQNKLESELDSNEDKQEVNTSSDKASIKTIVALQYIRNHIKEHGYISVDKALEQDKLSTKEIIKIESVAENIEFPVQIDNSLKNDIDIFTANFNKEVDYHKFLVNLILSEYVEISNISTLTGFFPSVSFIKRRIQTQEEKSSKRFLGAVGDKLELDAIYDKRLVFDGFIYGSHSYIYFFKSLDGNTIIWKTAKDIEIELYSKLEIKGIVKDNTVYDGEKQTVLSRCKIKEVE